MNKLFIVLFILALSVICFINSIESQAGSQFINAVSKEAVDTILNSQEVTLTDIHKNRKLKISPEQLQLFRSYLKNDSSYVFDMKKRCLFVPQLAFEFNDFPKVTIFVSMICNQVKIITGDKPTILDYDPAKDELNKLIEELINK